VRGGKPQRKKKNGERGEPKTKKQIGLPTVYSKTLTADGNQKDSEETLLKKRREGNTKEREAIATQDLRIGLSQH